MQLMGNIQNSGFHLLVNLCFLMILKLDWSMIFMNSSWQTTCPKSMLVILWMIGLIFYRIGLRWLFSVRRKITLPFSFSRDSANLRASCLSGISMKEKLKNTISYFFWFNFCTSQKLISWMFTLLLFLNSSWLVNTYAGSISIPTTFISLGSLSRILLKGNPVPHPTSSIILSVSLNPRQLSMRICDVMVRNRLITRSYRQLGICLMQLHISVIRNQQQSFCVKIYQMRGDHCGGSQNDENVYRGDERACQESSDRTCLKEKKAKRSLYELGLEEDNLFSIQLATPLVQRNRVVHVNAWCNINLDEGARVKKQKPAEQPLTQRNLSTRPFGERETNIPYLKDLLLKLESPRRLRLLALNKRSVNGEYFDEAIKNSYRSGRVSETIKLKENWNIRECQGRSTFLLPYSSLSCRLKKEDSKPKIRATSQNSKRGLQSIKQADLVKIIMQKKKQSMTKKSKVSPVKILNFNAKTQKPKSIQKQKFYLTQLLQ